MFMIYNKMNHENQMRGDFGNEGTKNVSITEAMP